MTLLTRQEIINEWLKQPKVMLESKCCPECRSILDEYEKRYFCPNGYCTVTDILKEV